jgi:pimeloyl-ACP methyl ester carboxylesterase
VSVPVHLYWGDKDILADPDDVKYLLEYLPNILGENGTRVHT